MKKGVHKTVRVFMKPALRDERQEAEAARIEEAGRRAMVEPYVPHRYERVVTERKLPHVSEAPRGARIIQSSHGVVSMVLGQMYLGMFAND
jgi:hypothetical protein